MAITQAMVTSFKVGILDGTFDFSSYIGCDHYGVFCD